MKENNNIDNLFKDNLDNLEMMPSERVWNGVEGTLFPPAQPKPVYRWRWALVALLLLLFSVGGWYLFFHQNGSGNSNTTEHLNQSDCNVARPSANVTNHPNVKENAANKSVPEQSTTTGKAGYNVKQHHVSKQQPNSVYQKSLSETGFNDNTTSGLKQSYREQSNTPETMHSVSIFSIAALPVDDRMQPQHEMLSVNQYIKKRAFLHYYTGAGAQAGMVYYPATQDMFTYAADVSVGLKAGKFYVETGAGYRFMQERGSYKIDFKTQDSVGYYNKVTSFEINPQDPDKIILNYKKTTVFDSVAHVAYTAPLFKYDYFTIPLRIGYRVFNRKNLFVALETGMEYSRLMRSFTPESGFYFEGSGDVKIVNKTPDRVVNNWKYLFSVRIGIKLTKSITLMVQPEFSKYANSIYKTGNNYSSVKPYMMNLRAGIYYDF